MHFWWQAERTRNRRPSVKESSFYRKWESDKHAIFTSYQALVLSIHGMDFSTKIEAACRIDCAYLLVDAARNALPKDRFQDFRRHARSLISHTNCLE
jgi:hypothetical protein